MPKVSIFKIGQTVVLLADEEKGWEEELGEIVEGLHEGCYLVKVFIIDSLLDDGLRRVSPQFMETI